MKTGFFEIEMVSASEYLWWIRELADAKCRYVIDHSEPIMCDDAAVYNVMSVYGEIPAEYEEGVRQESFFGFEYLKDEFEEKYGV